MSSPDPSRYSNFLFGVGAVAPDDAWVVGTNEPVEYQPRPLSEHWAGAVWKAVPVPTVGANLEGVAGVAPDDVWAVGDASGSGLIQHWNGSVWTTFPDPSGMGWLRKVTALAPDDVWAAGSLNTSFWGTLIEHWDGTRWSVVPSPDPGEMNELWSLTALSAQDIWAVGDWRGPASTTHTLTEHWNGVQWSVVPSPDLPGTFDNVLYAVGASGSDDVWAAGMANPLQIAILHWNGSSWQVASAPNLGPATLYGVVARAPQDVWAVGYLSVAFPRQALILHWDGQQWAAVAHPNPGSTDNMLKDVAADANGTLWAAGYTTDGQGSDHTLIERYSDPCVTPSPPPTPPPATVTPPPSPTPSPGPPRPSATPCALPFSDVHPTDYFYGPVQYLYCHGVISGYADNTFRPYTSTTRGQLAKIIVLAEGWTIDTSGGPHFSDVPPANGFYPYIETAYHRQIISGYSNGTFQWGSNVTRGQLAKIIVLAEGWAIDTSGGPHFSDVPPAHPFYAYVETAYHRGILSGYGDQTFRPGSPATRGQICKIVYNATALP